MVGYALRKLAHRMQRHGYEVSLRKVHGGAWVASFNRDPMLSSSGFGTGETPWLAVQRAAWAALQSLG